MYEIQTFLEKYIPKLRRQFDSRDPTASFMNYLSTSSAGKKIDIPLSSSFSKVSPRFRRLLQKGANKRVVQEAIQVPFYYDLGNVIADHAAPIKIVIRKQIERRQRGIAGLSNNRLKINHPVYEANKAFSTIAEAPSHGKQRGDCIDLHHLLYYSTLDGICISSIDISGMDTNIQVNVALHQALASIKILEGVEYDIGPFRGAEMMILITFCNI